MGWDCQIMCEKGLLRYDRPNGEIQLYNQNHAHNVGAAEGIGYTVIWKMYDAEKFNMIADLRGMGFEE